MKEKILMIVLSPVLIPIMLIMALMYVLIPTEEDELYLKSKMGQVKDSDVK